MAREWTHVDKSEWGDGPWMTEPDKIQWVDSATDLDCLMVRNPWSGNWCGYVGVPESHPMFGRHYDSVDVDVHGGLTFAALCDEEAEEGHGICHIPEPGRPETVWWLGFDCAHAYDLMPALEVRNRARGWDPLEPIAYRDRTFVTGQCAMLAQQLKEMA